MLLDEGAFDRTVSCCSSCRDDCVKAIVEPSRSDLYIVMVVCMLLVAAVLVGRKKSLIRMIRGKDAAHGE